MKQRAVMAACAAMALAATVAVADDAPSGKPVQSHRQLMRQCLAEQKAKSASATPADLKKFCEEQIKSYQEHPSAPTPQKAPSP